VTDKDKTEGKTQRSEKTEAKQKKIIIKPEHRRPKRPGTAYTQWFSDWIRTQPKADGALAAQNYIRQGAQTWHTVPEHDKQRYKEKFQALKKEHDQRMEEWREQIDPAVLGEMNRRRIAKGLNRIRGPSTGRRPASGFFRYFQEVRENTPRKQAQDNYPEYFKALGERAGNQWRAMSEAEKAEYNDPAKAEYAVWREKRKAAGHAKQ
jgi:hypothetical protein